MANPARRKGTAGESDIVEWLKANGVPGAERHALHGRLDIGDINGVPGLVMSVKYVGRDKPMRLSGWLNELALMQVNLTNRQPLPNELADGVLVVRRAGYPSPGNWYAVQTLGEWWKLYRAYRSTLRGDA